MKQIITPIVNKSLGILKSTRPAIFPFTEKPSEERINKTGKKADNSINATDLFSLFTADIIKEEVIFTR